MSESHFTLW